LLLSLLRLPLSPLAVVVVVVEMRLESAGAGVVGAALSFLSAVRPVAAGPHACCWISVTFATFAARALLRCQDQQPTLRDCCPLPTLTLCSLQSAP
jgi:hypothetical protein